MSEHAICRELLRQAREEAKKASVTIPKNLTALESFGQFFIEGDGMKGEWVQKADCALGARAEFIFTLIDRANDLRARGLWVEIARRKP